MADVQMPDGTVQQVPEPTPLETAVEAAGSVVGSIIEGIHDFMATPEDHARELMEHAAELDNQAMVLLSSGDVAGANALIAQASGDMNDAVQALVDPNGAQSHHADAGHNDPTAAPPDMTHMGDNSAG